MPQAACAWYKGARLLGYAERGLSGSSDGERAEKSSEIGSNPVNRSECNKPRRVNGAPSICVTTHTGATSHMLRLLHGMESGLSLSFSHSCNAMLSHPPRYFFVVSSNHQNGLHRLASSYGVRKHCLNEVQELAVRMDQRRTASKPGCAKYGATPGIQSTMVPHTILCARKSKASFQAILELWTLSTSLES